MRRILRKLHACICLKLKNQILRVLGAKIGKNCLIYTSLCNIDKVYTKNITIGNNVTIAKGVYLWCHDLAKNYIEKSKKVPFCEPYVGKIKIGDNCFIGTNAVILPDVTLGRDVVVGAGSIVTRSFTSNVVIGGNPAKIIKK